MEWSQKRKVLYAVAFVAFVILVAAYPVYRALNPTPTCFDGRQNGDEGGVDCGGSCSLYCASQMKDLRVVWAKAFPTAAGTYDLGAFIENPNAQAGIKELHYTLRALDETGGVLAEGKGITEVPPQSQSLLFAGNIVAVSVPATVEVVFDPADTTRWMKAGTAPLMLTTKGQNLVNADTRPRFGATLVNNDLVQDSGYVAVGAVIYDALRHPIAVSKTFVDNISKGGEESIVFTWPNRFTRHSTGGICTTPVDTMLVFDRSGSMDAGRKIPPEPLTTAKNAATAYLDAVDINDRVGLVSFATESSNPVDHELSLDHDAVKAAAQVIAIGKGSLQETDLGDALKAATVELGSLHHNKDAKKVIVVLTDGAANRPLDPANPKNTAYAETYAAAQADAARTAAVEMYAIGLGRSINEAFLRNKIATDTAHYFNAPTAAALKDIYQKISESVCKPENFITEVVITPKAIFTQ